MVSRTAEKPGLFDDNFITHLSSSQKLGKLEANRLELQWKKICDHEKRSKERNRELLKDFERVEKHAAMLSVKSERLKSYKQQYENYINKMYPRWREELENFRLSQQQSRNGPTRSTSGAPLLPPSSSSRTASAPQYNGNSQFSGTAAYPSSTLPYDSGNRTADAPQYSSDRAAAVPQYNGNNHFSSTPAHPPSSLTYGSGARFNRSPPEMHFTGNLHSSHLQDPYGKSSYHERQSDPSHMHDSGVLQSRYSQQADGRWQTPSFYDSHRHFDNRAYQSQFASSSREPDDVYQRSPDRYLSPSGRPFYDRHLPVGEVPRNFPPDTRYKQPEISHELSQGVRPAAPYEPRTELQRSYLGHGNHPGSYDQGGHGGRYYDGWQAGYYGDQRPAGFEPQRMEREISGRDDPLVDKKFTSGVPSRPAMTNGHDTVQDANHQPSANQPFVPPEKPLERNISVSSFPEPSLSSTVMETSAGSSEVRHNEVQGGASAIPTTTSQNAAKAVVKDRQVSKPEKEYVLKDHVSAKDKTEVLVKTREPEADPGESLGISSPLTSKSERIPEDGLIENSEDKSEDVNARKPKGEELVPPVRLESHKSEEAELSDGDESLDLSDLSLPDGNGQYIPSAMQDQRRDSKNSDGKRAEGNVGREDLDALAGPSKPDVVPDATKSVTEEISEDIPESVDLDGSEDRNDVPVYNEGERTLPSNAENVSLQPNEPDVRSDEEGRKESTNKAMRKDERKNGEDEGGTTVQKAKEEKKPSVSVDGFLALLQAVDADVEVSFSPEALYHSPLCSADMREEITRAAEVGSSLQSFDPNTVSMIVLEELPLLVSSSSAGCLISDKVLSEGVSCRSEKELRPFVESSLIKLWKSLFSHLVNVVTNNVMTAEKVGSMFGSLLISANSRHGKESQLLLCRILESAISDVSDRSGSPPVHDLDLEPRLETEAPYKDDVSIASEASSSTLGSTPPKVQPVKPSVEDRKQTPEPSASYDDDFEDEVPLTESAAYLKMVSSTRSEPDDDISDLLGNSGPQKQESEADDDVERELARSMSPPVTSPRTKSPSNLKGGKQKPKLSLFDTGTSTAVENADNKDLGDSWGGSSIKSVNNSDISDSESALSPQLSPDGGLGYIPTALESKEGQQAGQKEDKDNEKSEKSANDSKAKRKTDFWNTSDTESEVDLQLSTGGFDQDDDDFDFYG